MLTEVDRYWTNGANCAQASTAGLLDYYGFAQESSHFYQAFYPFGGGFKEGDVCGVVSGSLAALSFLLSKKKMEPEKIFEITAEFRQQFHAFYHTIRCYELTADYRDENHQTDPNLKDKQRARCDEAMDFAINTVLRLLNQTSHVS